MINWRTNVVPAVVALVVMAVAVIAFVYNGDDEVVGRDPFPPAASNDDTVLAEADGRVENDGDANGNAVGGAESGESTFSDLPTVTLAELPLEALDVLVLIDDGGPYPYRQDDGVFQNREGILPDHREGHYREYTVDTPGSADRGARRIVAGGDGERYYTDDHYDSFREVQFSNEPTAGDS